VKEYRWTGLTYGPEGYEEREYVIYGPLYHGGGRHFREGDQLKPGRRTNSWGDEGEYSRHVFFTTRLETAAAYARETGGHVYEVEPTGEFKIDYSGDDFKTPHPLNVTRRLDPEEWQHACGR
jgi:hypothetical protein